VDAGDLLRLRVIVEPSRSCAEAATASAIDGGAPRWQSLAIACFPGALVEQGIAATRDVLFVGTRHDGAAVEAEELAIRSADGTLTDFAAAGPPASVSCAGSR